MRPRASAAAIALVLALAAVPGASAQPIYKCRSADAKVTYQQMPCDGAGTQKRVANTQLPEAPADIAARRSLEREAAYGNELARGFATQARDREREQLERQAIDRQEQLARERALQEAAQAQPWMPPWGWPGRPGLARPGARPNP